jgi:NodT family efflux transporter outer membrane factor (OMF) lipoprotein
MSPMTRSHRIHRTAALCAALCAALSAACTVGPDFVRPTPQAPAHWSGKAIASSAEPAQRSAVTEQSPDLGAWWSGFGDPKLDSLIDRAMHSNLDLRAAVLRIDEARAQRAIFAAAYLPSVSVDASVERQRFSVTTPTGALFNAVGGAHVPGGASATVPNPYHQFQLSAGASWEIDLFGRVRRSVEAADANLQVSVEDHRAVMVSVLADVSRSYMELRGAQARLAIAKDNLITIDELSELTRQRRAAGLTSEIDVSNAAALSLAAHAEVPAFEFEITQNINQLSQLLALAPEALRDELASPAPVPAGPATVSIGVPAELARRRPDIREAEANLHAATAQIGVAVANLFPRLVLGATAGYQSASAGNLLEWASRFATVGPSLDLPVFDRGRWKAVKLYDVRAQEAALAYQRTVLNALHEVENALAAFGADQQRRVWLEATTAQNQDALTLSRQRYASGLANFIEVLDAERTLQQNQLALADSTSAIGIDLVRVYRALGGGWPQSPPAVP